MSRIFRSLETGQLPENYDNPQYELIDENGMKTDQNNISDFSYPVRVFNEDFIKRNLKFLIDPNGFVLTTAQHTRLIIKLNTERVNVMVGGVSLYLAAI